MAPEFFASTEMDVVYWSTSLWVKQGGAWIMFENRSDTIELHPTHWMPLPENVQPTDEDEQQDPDEEHEDEEEY